MERVRKAQGKRPAQSDASHWSIGRASFRKPCAWATLFFIFFAVAYSLHQFGDVPAGAQAVLMALVAIPVAVVGSSSWEHKVDIQNGAGFGEGEEGNSYDENV
jgi:hypothetical protein